jgi:hypothetical protein
MTDFLNQYMSKAWPDMVDTIRCEVISQARSFALAKGFSIPLEHTVTRLDSPPRFELMGNTLRGRMPANEAYRFSMGVHWRAGLVDIGVAIHVELFADMLIDPRQGAPTFHVAVGGDLVADIVDLTQFFKKQIQDSVTAGIGRQLGMFSTMRFDRARLPPAMTPRLIHGHPELSKGGAIDIVLVSDGFSVGEMPRFRDIVTAIRTRLLDPAPAHDNEPFASFRSVIRLWAYEAPLESPVGTPAAQVPLYRAVTGYHDPSTSSWKVSWSNLAILDSVGSQATQFGADVIVFVTNRDTLPDPSVRAAAGGPVVMLPASDSTAVDDATTLLHELGHTQLGKLADEYSESGYGEYMGPEPVAPNVSTVVLPTVPPSTPKWPLWSLVPGARPGWDKQAIGATPGARYYAKGIYRPAAECKMSDSSKCFCAVCREAVTRQMMASLGAPEFIVECTPRAGTTTRLRLAYPHLGGPYLAQLAFDGPSRVTLLSSPLPEPWEVTFSGPGVSDSAGSACTFDARVGTTLGIKVVSKCPFTPWNRLPTYALQLSAVAAAHPSPATPTAVQAGLASPLGGMWLCLLKATSRNPDGHAVTFEFTAERATPPHNTIQHTTGWLTPSAETGEVVGVLGRAFGEGTYRLRARARDINGGVSAESGWTTFVVPPAPR